MENLVVQISKELLDMSGENINSDESIYIEINKLKTYNIMVSDCHEFLDNLLVKIKKLKGDWYNISRNNICGLCFASIDLIFHGKEISSENNDLLKNIMEMIDNYIQTNQITQSGIIDTQSQNFSEEGFFIYLDDNDLDINYSELEKVFINNNVEFKKISFESINYQGGAGNYLESILYYVVGMITPIIIENIFQGLLNVTKEKVVKIFRRDDFLKVRKDVADKVGIKEEFLLVSKINKEENNTRYVFKTTEKEIDVIVDTKCNIINMEVNEI
ncbi:MAG: hypothetical protein V8S33_03740 [Intestinibacter bartlettii]